MKIIVTGATGFIGKALCKELINAGHEIFAIIRPHSSRKESLKQEVNTWGKNPHKIQLLEMEMEELEQLSKKIGQADLFYHLAWNGSAGTDREDFEMQYKNIEYTAKAIKTAKECGCKKIIGAGSQAEYGVVKEIAKEEETNPHPFMMYGAAKLAAYQMGQVLAKQLEIPFIWPRIYSVYGVGENPGTLVNYVIDTLKKGDIPELSPCENMWNYIYITDCVRVLRLLGEKDVSEGIYHIASDDTRILKEFVEEIRDIVAPGSALHFGAKQSNPKRTFWLEPDTEKIKKIDRESEKVSFFQGITKKIQGGKWFVGEK